MGSEPWGRVDEQGNVYVRTAEGERQVGSWAAGSPDEALAFFQRKFDGLAVEVELLERRVRKTDAAALPPKEAAQTLERLRHSIIDAAAVGDLASLLGRLDVLAKVVEERREEAKAAKSRAVEEARAAKERIVAEAETIAGQDDWRAGGERLRKLVDEWKGLARLERKADDELWARFSQARSAFTKRRKHHFHELDSQREEARTRKEKLVAEAEALAGSTDWNNTSARLRDLMQRWKASGRAHREAEEELWQRFRGAQDRFFGARSAVYAERDAEFAENLTRKEELATEAEKLLPITDYRTARNQLRALLERWEAVGMVPRDDRPKVEGRLAAVERAIREAEEEHWRRTNPEARARAEAAVAQLRTSIEQLTQQAEKARASGNAKKLAEAEAALAARGEWLVEAEKTLAEFGG